MLVHVFSSLVLRGCITCNLGYNSTTRFYVNGMGIPLWGHDKHAVMENWHAENRVLPMNCDPGIHFRMQWNMWFHQHPDKFTGTMPRSSGIVDWPALSDFSTYPPERFHQNLSTFNPGLVLQKLARICHAQTHNEKDFDTDVLTYTQTLVKHLNEISITQGWF